MPLLGAHPGEAHGATSPRACPSPGPPGGQWASRGWRSSPVPGCCAGAGLAPLGRHGSFGSSLWPLLPKGCQGAARGGIEVCSRAPASPSRGRAAPPAQPGPEGLPGQSSLPLPSAGGLIDLELGTKYHPAAPHPALRPRSPLLRWTLLARATVPAVQAGQSARRARVCWCLRGLRQPLPRGELGLVQLPAKSRPAPQHFHFSPWRGVLQCREPWGQWKMGL